VSQAPVQLTAVAARVEAALALIFEEERAIWHKLDPALDAPLGDLADFVAGGGKRIRPAYCHWGYVTAGGSPDDADLLAACCAVELLQNWSFLNQPTESTAVKRMA